MAKKPQAKAPTQRPADLPSCPSCNGAVLWMRVGKHMAKVCQRCGQVQP